MAKTGLITSLRFYFAFFCLDERYGDFATVTADALPAVILTVPWSRYVLASCRVERNISQPRNNGPGVSG